MKTFWSNCVIEALKQKFLHWRNVKLVFIWCGLHFHMMWYDMKRGKIRHFTHRNVPGGFSRLWFKGHYESVKHKHLLQWCREHNVKLTI